MSLIKSVFKRIELCVIHRRLPLRDLFGTGLVNTCWQRKLENGLKITTKMKVGFGLIVSGEDDLHVRKWRIDPIVNCINETSEKYCAGIFMNAEEAQKFDLVLIVREVGRMDHSKIMALKRNNKKLIYDIVDRPYGEENAADYLEMRKIFQAMDGLIASSPLNIEDLSGLGKKIAFIEHPVLNTLVKDYAKKDHRGIKIIWQGFREHHKRMEFLHPVIKRLSKELNKEITMTYHTNMPSKKSGFIKYKRWTVYNWENELVGADIAVEVKSLNDPFLQRKPSTKIILYAAAGLPVICTPSAADKLVMTHGKTGYFAHNEEEWYIYLKKLAEDVHLRKTMGLSARKYVLENFSIGKITRKYIDLFDQVAL